MSNARLDKQKLDGKLTQSKAKLDRSKWTKKIDIHFQIGKINMMKMKTELQLQLNNKE